MQYIGGFSGTGTVTCEGHELARASYDFEAYYSKQAGVTCGGEIQLPSASMIKKFFGRRGLQLVADDSRIFKLKFSDKKAPSGMDTAHVDVTGDLPIPARHVSKR